MRLIKSSGPIAQPHFQPVTHKDLPAEQTVMVRSHMPGKVARVRGTVTRFKNWYVAES